MRWPGERYIATGQQHGHAGGNDRTTSYKLHQIILLVGLIERLSRFVCTDMQRESTASTCRLVDTVGQFRAALAAFARLRVRNFAECFGKAGRMR